MESGYTVPKNKAFTSRLYFPWLAFVVVGLLGLVFRADELTNPGQHVEFLVWQGGLLLASLLGLILLVRRKSTIAPSVMLVVLFVWLAVRLAVWLNVQRAAPVGWTVAGISSSVAVAAYLILIALKDRKAHQGSGDAVRH